MVDKAIRIPKSLHEPNIEEIFPNLQAMVPTTGEIDREKLRAGLKQTEMSIKWLIETVQMLNRRVYNALEDVIAGGVETTTIDVVVDVQYDATSHKFQEKTETITVLAKTSNDSWANWGGGQPTSVRRMKDIKDAGDSPLEYQYSTMYVMEDDAGTSWDDLTLGIGDC